jgi:F420-non-reducing hydrogenase iron-sulfur subunit
MEAAVCKDALIYVCHNCIPGVPRLQRQWTAEGVHVRVQELPCTGKISTQYLFHALEGGARGVCVVTCPLGECTLTQGNYRAKIRVENVRRLLSEIGLEPERVQIIHFSSREDFEKLDLSIRNAVQGFLSLGPNPVSESEHARREK